MNKVKKILYCGMADDIMSPLILEGHLEDEFNEMIIYVIDAFDPAYSSTETLDGQRDDIVNILKNGSDESSINRLISLEENDDANPFSDEKFPEQTYTSIHTLPFGKCVILSDVRKSNKWILKFIYGKFNITLISFSHDFVRRKWANEICDLSAIIFIGSHHFKKSDKKFTNFTKMLNTRRHKTQPCAIYTLSFLHTNFPEHFIIKNGQERCGSFIGRIYLQNNDDAMKLYRNWDVNDSDTITFL